MKATKLELNQLILKLKPKPNRCCCFHCLPNEWNQVNKLLFPNAQITDEGSVLVKINEEAFHLECHESGPEIIIKYEDIAVALSIISSIVTILAVFIKPKKQSGTNRTKFILVKKSIKNNIITEKIIYAEQFGKENVQESLTKTISDVINREVRDGH